MAGPCAIESRTHAEETAHALVELTGRLGIPFVYKSSYDKANRTSIDSPRGIGMKEGLAILAEVRERYGCPVLTDVHAADQCAPTAEAVDVLQIPAFLCRQTDLLLAAARTGRAVNVKKGQFLAPEDARHAVEKAAAVGNHRIFVTERGVSFGYHNLVVDMRSFTVLHELGIPVVFDVTHSLQLPGQGDGVTGGDRRFAEPLARAAVAAGADGLFMEVHPDPDRALSDAATQLTFERAEALAISALEIRRALQAAVPLA
ncbi:MAG TPA: 3-deoxy-8-phosphooctulonate synthase [Thermoanaerobaculia bacterium]|nr:3-deoxy-8-phosphooctulonate synthase [Thermoanaerobaculia bacterium]